MKNLIILQGILVLTISSSAPLCGMMTKFTTNLKLATKKLQWRTQQEAYIPINFLTDSAMLLGSSIAYGYLKLAKNSSSHKQAIQNQLDIIKNDLEEDKRNIIKDLAKDYNITNEQLNKITSQLKTYKDCATKQINNRCPSWSFAKRHDKDFPLTKALPLLEKNNIDPDTIWLIKSKIPHEEQKWAAMADALSFSHYQNTTESKADYHCIISKDIDSPPIITLYPSSDLYQEDILIHEIGHITQHHSLENSIISSAIHRLTKINYQDIYANENYKRLIQQYEREAEILPALKFKEDASALRKTRRSVYYPEMLYGEHYLTLAFIDTLHKIDARIKE